MTEPNPYAAPKSEIGSLNVSSGRPGWVWVIFIFYAFSFISTVVSYGLLLSGKISIPTDKQQYLNGLTSVDYAVSLLMVVINVVAALLLFRLKKISLHFFMLALLISVLYTIWRAATTGWLGAVGGAGIVSLLFSYGLKIAICFLRVEADQYGRTQVTVVAKIIGEVPRLTNAA